MRTVTVAFTHADWTPALRRMEAAGWSVRQIVDVVVGRSEGPFGEEYSHEFVVVFEDSEGYSLNADFDPSYWRRYALGRSV